MNFIKRIRKIFFLIRMIFLYGEKRAALTKKISYFSTQGENCYFGIYNFGTEPWMISFGSNVVVATGVRFINHDMSAEMISQYLYTTPYKLSKYGEITVGSNVFIGADSIILPNVKIGSNVIIGAGSIISKDLKEGGVYVGNGRFVRTFDTYVSENLNYIKESNKKIFKRYANYFNLKDLYLEKK